MLEVADVVYVLAPLGKLLPYTSEEINLLRSGDVHGYSSLGNCGKNSEKVTMIATTRPPGYLKHLKPPILTKYFGMVQGQLEQLQERHVLKVLEKSFDPLDEISVRVQASLVGKGAPFGSTSSHIRICAKVCWNILRIHGSQRQGGQQLEGMRAREIINGGTVVFLHDDKLQKR